MDIAVFHDLPLAGGAPRVLAEYLRRLPDRITLYTHASAGGPALVDFAVPAERTVRLPLAAGNGPIATYRRMLTSDRAGRALARAIDAKGHDAMLCFPSVQTQAPALLSHLRTPSLYYAPEPLRAEYDAPPTLRTRLSPYTVTRRRVDRRAIASATRVTTLSRFMAERLADVYGIVPDVVYPGVDAELIRPGMDARDGSVLSVGALAPVKGHELVIEALGRLPEPRPMLTVIGDRGEDGPRLADVARARGVSLQLLSGVPFAEVIAHYRRASVVACAAIGEPFGLTPLEAMAAGTPVVAVDEGGYRETVDCERTGLRVPRDADMLAQAIVRVLSDAELAAGLSARGRADVVGRWTWDASATAIRQALEALAH
ncbi:MAG TPA: glycosyltransferase family 4 protein [Thermoleophilaceae bacterium]